MNKAIIAQRNKIWVEESDLVMLIGLTRAKGGRHGKYSLNPSGSNVARWYEARIIGKDLVINKYRGSEFYRISTADAQRMWDELEGK